ncbi:MAG: hypothetical protein QOG23_2422 [Blastocatellia bacterium]|jgi:chromosome segregation ATPase|nr:hypothetical protein [Blastocatellia bacterium]
MRKKTKSQAPAIALQNQNDARLKINAKIAVLQRYSKKGVPNDAYVPKSLEQFRSWTDKQLELAQIGSKSTLYHPWNSELKTEIGRLIKLLSSRHKTSRNGPRALDGLRAEKIELKFTLKQLAGEMHETRQQLQFERRESERKDHRITDLREENAKLTAQLRQRTGLYPVK